MPFPGLRPCDGALPVADPMTVASIRSELGSTQGCRAAVACAAAVLQQVQHRQQSCLQTMMCSGMHEGMQEAPMQPGSRCSNLRHDRFR